MIFLVPRATIQNDFASGDKKDKKYVTDTLVYFFLYSSEGLVTQTQRLET